MPSKYDVPTVYTACLSLNQIDNLVHEQTYVDKL